MKLLRTAVMIVVLTFIALLIAVGGHKGSGQTLADHQTVPGADHGHASFWISEGGYRGLADNISCCGENDCHIIPDEDVRATATGWRIESLGETVPYSESQTSEDGKFWRCRRNDGSRRCFFAAQPGS